MTALSRRLTGPAGPLGDEGRRAPRPARRVGAATLGELGYAQTCCARSPKNSEFSHGVVHYYFDDKIELITYCVRYYKAQCVTRYDELVGVRHDGRRTAPRFADKLIETLTDEPPMHRLWYDLRTQAMFEASSCAMCSRSTPPGA